MGIEKIFETLKPKETKNAVISYRTTPEIKAFFKRYAKQEGTTMQDIFNEALTMYLTEKRDELEKDIKTDNHKEGVKM